MSDRTKFPVSLILAGALAFAATTASATTVTLTFHGPTAGAETRRAVVTAAPVVLPGVPRVRASGLNLVDTSGTLGAFTGWSLDLEGLVPRSPAAARRYKDVATPFSNSTPLDAAGLARVQALFDANYSDLDTTSGTAAAAFQLALWDAIYDGDGRINRGVFAVRTTRDIRQLANSYVAAARAFDGDEMFGLTFLESRTKTKLQNMVAATSLAAPTVGAIAPSPVPVPAAGGLLMLALAGLGLSARRRRKAA